MSKEVILGLFVKHGLNKYVFKFLLDFLVISHDNSPYLFFTFKARVFLTAEALHLEPLSIIHHAIVTLKNMTETWHKFFIVQHLTGHGFATL